MMVNKTNIKPNEEKHPQIYGYTLTDKIPEKNGFIKVGYTERTDAKQRIHEQASTAAFRVHPHFEFKRDAIFKTVGKSKDGKWFTDKQLHKFFIRNGAKRASNAGGDREWFNMPNKKIPDWAINLTDRYRYQDFKIDSHKTTEYILRDEQKEAVKKTLNYYKSKKDPRFLWNAKPRFGKTLTAYDFAIKAGFKKILVATNRPAIANSWYQDYSKFIGNKKYIFVSTADSLKNEEDNPLVFKYSELDNNQKSRNLICFFSLQDLKGAEWAGGKKKKLEWVRDMNWDLLIVDEAHEGAETVRTDSLFEKIKRKFSLYLSGTPFTALKRGEFNPNQIFTWSYENEQNKKKEYAIKHPETINPYQNPSMSLFVYRLSDMVKDKALGQIDQGNFSYDLKSFFQTKRDNNGTPKFIHEDLVRQFLKSLASGKKFPFSTSKLRGEMRHTLWLLDRIDSARALQALLEEGSTKIDKFTGDKAEDYNPYKASFNVIKAYGSSSKDSSNNSDEQDNRNQLKEASDNSKNESSYQKVIKGIEKAEKAGKGTITLSCGQLTTGVTIKPWSGILMLNNTVSPSLYFQAAFRAQNPYEFNKNGKHYRKERAYVFDFSPERALEVYGTFATGLNSRPVTNHDAYDKQINNMVNLFPVISENETGEMQETNTDYIISLPQKYKSDKVFEKGFDSSYLINDLSLNDLSQNVVDAIANINLSKATNSNTDKIDINHNELANNNTKKSSRSKHASSVQQNSQNNKKIKQDELKEKAKDIARVMPSLIFAYADGNINLNNFANYIPDNVINEIFNIDKQEFISILNSDLYNGPVFHQAALDLVNLSKKVKSNFNLNNIHNLFDKLPSINKNLVYTPLSVVDNMLDILQEEYPGIFDNPKVTFIDPFVKSGSFLFGIVNRLFNSLNFKKIFPDESERLTYILDHQIYGIATKSLFRDMVKSLLPMDKSHISYQSYDFKKKHMKENELLKMKFNVVIGNPPYNKADGGARASASPIYNKFVDLSKTIDPDITSLIIPSRWYTGGKGLNSFRNTMLQDKHIKTLYDFSNPEEVFPHTNIRGGVCIFVRDNNFNNSKTGVKIINMRHGKKANTSFRPLNSLDLNIFIRDEQAIEILKKIQFDDGFSDLVSARKPFGLGGTFIKSSNFMESSKDILDPVKVYGKNKVGYTSKKEIVKNKSWIGRVKVLTARSNNIGTELKDDNLNAFVARKNTACTETYLVIGADQNLTEHDANHIVLYLKTKFVRFLIGIAKASHDASRKTYKFVPNQNFTSESDIEWSKSISEIDRQLFKKYNLSKDEIDFIETKVQAMN